MKEKIIYKSSSLYREDFTIKGFSFGSGEKTACIIGNTRGNEYQQLYCSSLLVRALKKAEEHKNIIKGHEILVIPSANPYSMNISKRFWPIDNTDINRMFPGYVQGETTQRIAGGIFDKIKDYKYGIQFVSNYLPGRFMPSINVMKTGFEDPELAKKFGMPYVVLRNTRPYDTTTLNYNWQIWETKAFSLYTTDTENIDRLSAAQGVRAILSFLSAVGAVSYKGHTGFNSQIIDDKDIFSVRTTHAGLFEPFVRVEQEVMEGAPLGRILDPLTAEVVSEIYAPRSGIVFFIYAGPMIYGHTALFKLIPTM